MTNEDYVPLDLGRLLREKGFNEPCRGCYSWETDEDDNDYVELSQWIQSPRDNSTVDDYFICSAPTLQEEVCKWLREKYDIYIYSGVVQSMTITFDQKYYYPVVNIHRRRKICKELEQTCRTPEEAIKVAIRYTLENLIKNSKNSNIHL